MDGSPIINPINNIYWVYLHWAQILFVPSVVWYPPEEEFKVTAAKLASLFKDKLLFHFNIFAGAVCLKVPNFEWMLPFQHHLLCECCGTSFGSDV